MALLCLLSYFTLLHLFPKIKLKLKLKLNIYTHTHTHCSITWKHCSTTWKQASKKHYKHLYKLEEEVLVALNEHWEL